MNIFNFFNNPLEVEETIGRFFHYLLIG